MSNYTEMKSKKIYALENKIKELESKVEYYQMQLIEERKRNYQQTQKFIKQIKRLKSDDKYLEILFKEYKC